VCLFLLYGNRKAVEKTCRGHVFRTWEIPTLSERSPWGCEMKGLRDRTNKKEIQPFGVCLFCCTEISHGLV